METTALPNTQQTFDKDSLLLSALVFRDANRTIAGVHGIVAALLYYALIGASITNNLIELTATE
jgi:hypothetical protein